MKNIFRLTALFFTTLLFGQQISDYQYIQVPDNFKDFQINQYGINELFASKLKAKKFIIIGNNLGSLPKEVDVCEVLTADLVDSSSLFKNKVKINFQDCNGKTVASFEGKSTIKEFEPGMRDALVNAAQSIAPSNATKKIVVATKTAPVVTPAQSLTVIPQEIKPDVEKTVSAKIATSAKSQTGAEVYSNGSLKLNKIFLLNGEFILTLPTDSVPFAIFKPSTKQEVYRVQLSDGTSTLGYMEGENIVIEMPNTNGSYRKEIFKK